MTLINSKTIAILLSSVFISTTVLPVANANADHKSYRKHYQHKKHYKNHDRHHAHRKHKKSSKRSSSKGDKIAAGIIGFAIGALLVSEAAKANNRSYQPTYHQPKPIYREPINFGPTKIYDPYYVERRSLNNVYTAPTYKKTKRTNYDAPKVITYADTVASVTYEPWTQQWQNYCSNRYRSFNPNTGTFRGYDGLNHFCVAK
ncbi:MAG: BA14K family protein [Rhizobiales bacterium]|nr:BA14K family protein [Hyphomicrobiales bacterium]